MKNFAVVLAGGLGTRTGYDTAKQLLKIGGKPVMHFVMDVLEAHPRIDGIVLVVNPAIRKEVQTLLPSTRYRKLMKIVDGGESRLDSSRIGVRSIPESQGNVLIHDAVRPFMSSRIIDAILNALEAYSAVDVAIEPTDTIIRVDEHDLIEEIPDRAVLRRGQTPQGFRLDVIREAHTLAVREGQVRVTDDCGLVLRYGLCKVFVVPGERTNIKITYPEDLYLADRIFQLRGDTLHEDVDLHRLEGSVLAVIGGTRGIGKAIVKLGRAHGARVFPCSRATGVDVANHESISKFLKRLQEQEELIHHVFNCAAVLRKGRLDQRSPEELREEVEINYLGALNLIVAALPYLRQTRGSITLFTSSSYTRGRPFYVTYSSAKAAIVNLVQGLTEELETEGITINAINPERSATPMRFENFGEEPPETLLKPEEVALAALKTAIAPISGMVIDVRRSRQTSA